MTQEQAQRIIKECIALRTQMQAIEKELFSFCSTAESMWIPGAYANAETAQHMIFMTANYLACSFGINSLTGEPEPEPAKEESDI